MNTHSNTTDEQTITLYKYIKAEYLPEFLNTGYLKVSKIGEVNDPFEYAPSFDQESGFNKLVKELLGSKAPHVSFADTKEIREAWREKWTNWITHSKVRYISFSSLCSSPLMWGHYGDNHKGVCLVFRFKLHEMDAYFPNTQLSTIIYSKERVSDIPMILSRTLDINQDAVFHLFQRLCACTKAKEWEYEQEARLYINQKIHLRERNGIRLYGDVRDAFCGVILGVNFEDNPTEIKADVHTALKRSTTSVTHAYLSLKEFRIENDVFSDITSEEYAQWSNKLGMKTMVEDYKKLEELAKVHYEEMYERKLASLGMSLNDIKKAL